MPTPVHFRGTVASIVDQREKRAPLSRGKPATEPATATEPAATQAK